LISKDDIIEHFEDVLIPHGIFAYQDLQNGEEGKLTLFKRLRDLANTEDAAEVSAVFVSQRK
jgi:hypothetical protein